MPKKWSHKECFDYFGTVPSNVRWSWSARSRDGKTVAVTFWQDKFESHGAIYRSDAHARDQRWFGSPGHKELIENLIWARDHCDGIVRIIIAIAKDKTASPRTIEQCFPQETMKMRLTFLNDATGDFVAERI